MSCVVTRRRHNLQEIYSEGQDTRYVVRWCTDCGAIVVDVDVDGRVMPGRYSRMKFPRIALEAATTDSRVER
jgi:hypothetical protein